MEFSVYWSSVGAIRLLFIRGIRVQLFNLFVHAHNVQMRLQGKKYRRALCGLVSYF